MFSEMQQTPSLPSSRHPRNILSISVIWKKSCQQHLYPNTDLHLVGLHVVVIPELLRREPGRLLPPQQSHATSPGQGQC